LGYDLRTFYSSEQIKKNKMGGTLACMGDRRSTYRAFVGEREGEEHLEYLAVDGRIILKWV
jgi:hypothetical protein